MSASLALDERTCDYCGQPAEGTMGRVVPGDPASPRVAYAHGNCFRLHIEAIDVLVTGQQFAEVAL